MRSVTVRIHAAEFSGTMTAIGEWLNANQHKPTRYKYDHTEDAVLVTIDFPAAAEADAFTMRFDSIHQFRPQPTSDTLPQLPE